MDRGIPTEEVLEQMRGQESPAQIDNRSFRRTGTSRGDRIWSGVPVIKNLEKVDEVRFLLGTELEIAYLGL